MEMKLDEVYNNIDHSLEQPRTNFLKKFFSLTSKSVLLATFEILLRDISLVMLYDTNGIMIRYTIYILLQISLK